MACATVPIPLFHYAHNSFANPRRFLGTYVPPPPGTDTTRTANVYAHTRSHGFGAEVQKRIILGTYALAAECVPALSPVPPASR